MQKMKVLLCLTVTLTFFVSQSSAIPMWEYLSREEKMGMLFNMYTKQVQSYCKTQDGGQISNCKHNMMMYGVVKLNEMDERSLDKMDPYQRNADNLLWDSMMNDDYQQQPSSAASVDERQEYLQNEQFHQQQQSQQQHFHKEEEDEEVDRRPLSFNEDEDEMGNYLHHDGAATHFNFAYASKPDDLDQHEHLEQNSNYLTGPMVSYMMPDGSPVDGMVQQMPIDEDREDMEMMKTKMPSMHEIYRQVETMDEKPKIIIASPPSASSSDSTTTQQPEPEQQHQRQSRIVKTISGAYRALH